MSGRFVGATTTDGIAVVRIGDPNGPDFVAARHPMHRELRDVFSLLADDESVRAVVLTGAGEQFCPAPTLGNLDALLSASDQAARDLQREAREIVANVIAFPKPLVAAVNGPAYGMGAQLALLADFVVAWRGAELRDLHVRLGLTAGDGGTLVWPLAVGLPRARRMLLRSEPLAVEEAEELGLIAELADSPAAAVAQAEALARSLVDLPAFAYSSTKAALNRWLALGEPSFEIASAFQEHAYESDEFSRRRRRAGDEETGGEG
ncbi:MAG: enoyl-CoA hydratase-related protein [Solirubrobacterales bacterium]